ncbi:GNAT family N-acetyltransferase [Aureimonas sp. AU4]|uniref:GNAT family N-acetyltransferase n=1 Tax=Aureimonas sp. AU4 TaxID=1638163 RepID=UPI0007844CE7|nr:GNAT family N-acetyltransferase [Aureimonas sp. AU4]
MKRGGKPFRGMAPEPYRIRMMEPGEAMRLREIDRRAGQLLVEAGHIADAEPLAPGRFVQFLLAHEVFVAEQDGEAVGFAASVDLAEILAGEPEAAEGAGCTWLSALSVDPDHGRRGLGSALLTAVVARAGWFFQRAVALSTARDLAFNEGFYARRGFLAVPPADRPPALRKRFDAELPPGVDPARRTVMVRWL